MLKANWGAIYHRIYQIRIDLSHVTATPLYVLEAREFSLRQPALSTAPRVLVQKLTCLLY